MNAKSRKQFSIFQLSERTFFQIRQLDDFWQKRIKAPKHIPTTRPTNNTEITKIVIVSIKVFENLLEYVVV